MFCGSIIMFRLNFYNSTLISFMTVWLLPEKIFANIAINVHSLNKDPVT